ncbi:MAG: ABC transporter substrate-binding protein [Oscillospiraceae bacterium]|nr:ABC transporter substrate-binding protein [Oscillospiraceae bacterium]
MKTMKKIVAAVLALALCLCMMAGCSGSADISAQLDAIQDQADAIQDTLDAYIAEAQAAEEAVQEAAAEEAAEAEEAEEAAVTVEDLEPDEDGYVTIVDMAGREVTFKANPVIWNSSPTAEGWLCAIVPEQLVGWAAEFTEDALAYYPESVRDLETVGGNYGTSTANEENILVVSPDVIINTFDCSEEGLESTIASADEMAEEYGIPVVCLSRDIADSAECAANIGLWFGNAQRGYEVSVYIQSLLDMVTEAAEAAAAAGDVPTFYYAEQATGLFTEAVGSMHAAVFEFCGLTNCVGDDISMTSMGGLEEVTLEQVVQWDPDYIFVWLVPAYQEITTSDAWSGITAVQNGDVYSIPLLPQNWFDRSPNSLRVLGCLYCAAICYADYVSYDLTEVVSDHFSFMYGVELTDAQLEAIYCA